MAEKFYNTSSYAYTLNNPINYIDPDGRDVIGAKGSDANQVVNDIKNIFSDQKFAKFRSLVKRDRWFFGLFKSKRLAKIEKSEFDSALNGVNLTSDESQALQMTYNTINSEDSHKVEFADQGSDLVSNSAENAFKNKLPSYINVSGTMAEYGGLKARFIAGNLGGAATVETRKGTHSLIIRNHPDVNGAITTIHELIGHGRSLALGRQSSQHEDAVKTENLFWRVTNQPGKQINGSNHGPKTQIQNFNAKPNFN